MSNSLYEEAIIAAEQIKEAAENKVKQQLIESMSPQIKVMVEKALLGEDVESQEEESTSEEYDASETEKKEEHVQEMPQPTEEYHTEIDKTLYDVDMLEDADMIEGFLENDEDNEVEINNESVEVFKKLITKNARTNALKKKLSEIREGIKSLKKVILLTENNNISKKSAVRIVEAYKNLCQELKNIKTNSIIKSDTKLLKEYLEISKELNNMSRRQSKNYLNESLEDLLEMNLFEEDEDTDDTADAEEADKDLDDKDLDDKDLDDAADAEEADFDLDDLEVEADEDDDLSSEDAEGLRSIADKIEEILSDDESDEMEDESEEGDIEESEVFEIDDLGEEDVVEAELEESSRRSGELFLEIDENMLKREISKMRNIREGEAKEMASHFGGGSVEGEVFVKGVQLNKRDKMKNEAAVRKVVKKNRILESKLAQHKKAIRKMKGQLSEMNLFNAKLLYANKLMQNRDLSIKQQRKIVESLDNAKTLNEAKILFEGLTTSLSSSKSRKSGNLAEGSNRRLIGSSSRSTSSAQSSNLNESVALNRWATLAGIKK
jgi:hypothetical protein